MLQVPRFGHVMHECPAKDRIKIIRGIRLLQAIVESDGEGNEDCLSEFCFMAIEEENEEDFKRTFEELYMKTICMTKKNKELK